MAGAKGIRMATDQRTATRILEIPTLATDGTELSLRRKLAMS